jgi:hypothetical protein
MPGFPLYVDPTAAGLGLQFLLGGIVGGLVAVKLFWGRIFSLFRRNSPDPEEALTTSEAPEASEEEV